MPVTKEELLRRGEELSRHPQLVLYRDKRDALWLRDAMEFLRAIPEKRPVGRRKKEEEPDA